MKKNVLVLIAFVLLLNCVSALVFEVDANFVKEPRAVEVENVRVIEGTPDSPNPMGNYEVKVLGLNGSILWETKYFITFELFIDGIGGGGAEEHNVFGETLYLKHFEEASAFVFEFEGRELYRFELEEETTCNNNGTCEEFETNFSCAADCPPDVSDGYCNKERDGFCDPDCAEDVDFDCRKEEFKDCGDGVCGTDETIVSCRKDCTGRSDDVCDRVFDQRCDPDCGESQDIDCRKEACNKNGICERGETKQNCAQDCLAQTNGYKPEPPSDELKPDMLFIVSVGVALLLVIIAFAWFFLKKKG